MQASSENVFVFVVCGAKEHLDTLHFSLKYLKHFSTQRIIVLTDPNRNEIAVEHDDIVEVTAPVEFNHHQASIYLKTSIHRHLPIGPKYCYLDTDVVAISWEVDGIFDQFCSPITFAPDHCKLNNFSAQAVKCGCLESKRSDRARLREVLDGFIVKGEHAKLMQPELHKEFLKNRQTIFLRMSNAIRFVLARNRFQLSDRFWFDKKKRIWMDNEGHPIMHEFVTSKVEKATGLKFRRSDQKWLDKLGYDVWLDECDHLIERIHSKFGIRVQVRDWQHWNGGVFLFDNTSTEFLDLWHRLTMEIFADPEWRTRDQGTLIATVWKLGLENAPTLSKKWNFIADHENESVRVDAETGTFTDNDFQTFYEPAFVHVYHHFGDRSWSLWNQVEAAIDKTKG